MTALALDDRSRTTPHGDPLMRPRCPLDSDWCDGHWCRDHGVACPRSMRSGLVVPLGTEARP